MSFSRLVSRGRLLLRSWWRQRIPNLPAFAVSEGDRPAAECRWCWPTSDPLIIQSPVRPAPDAADHVWDADKLGPSGRGLQ